MKKTLSLLLLLSVLLFSCARGRVEKQKTSTTTDSAATDSSGSK